MGTHQLESGCTVIKCGWLPGGGGVTGLTELTQAALVGILADVAGVTVGGGTLIDTINMTARTGGADMRTSQLERSSIVIE